MFCSKCETQLAEEAVFCQKCGARKGEKSELFIDKSNSPKYLFADNDNLYFLLQEGSKIFKKNHTFIFVYPHGSSTFSKLGTVEARQMFCYGEYLYYVAPTKDSHIYKMRKDGSGNEIFIAQNAWDDISVYNDKLYFRDADKKNQLICVDLNGQNPMEIGAKKTSDYFISNNVIYHTASGVTANKLSYYKMRDGSTGTTPGFDGVVLNIVDGFAFTYPVNTEKLQNHPLTRYDINNNSGIIGGIPADGVAFESL